MGESYTSPDIFKVLFTIIVQPSRPGRLSITKRTEVNNHGQTEIIDGKR